MTIKSSIKKKFKREKDKKRKGKKIYTVPIKTNIDLPGRNWVQSSSKPIHSTITL